MDVSKTTIADLLLTPEEAANFLNLAKSRVNGDGPEFVKIGRAVRYLQSSLRKFIKARTRSSTNDQ